MNFFLPIIFHGTTRGSLIMAKTARETVRRFQLGNLGGPAKGKWIGSLDDINFVPVRRGTK
jgi:hypothetical protein